jgi:uncharacterized membrane protein YbhN (UPF0104 family)
VGPSAIPSRAVAPEATRGDEAEGFAAPAPARRRALPAVLLAVGVAVFGWLVWSAGWSALRANLALIGWRFAALVALYAAAQSAFAAAWLLVLSPLPGPRDFRRILAAYLAGDTINYLTPGNVAGEPLKAHLLKERFGGGAAVVSLALHKQAELLAQCAYVAIGVAVALTSFTLPALVQVLALAGAAGLAAAFALMTWAFRRGSFAPILRRLSRIPWLGKRLARLELGASEVDARILDFHGRHPLRFAGAAALCLAGWCGGLVETYIVLGLLTHRYTFGTSFAIEALAMVAGNMLLFMPGRVGSAEGSRVAVFVLLGLSAAQGVAYGLVRRARELIWVGIGGLLLLERHVKP